MSSYQVTKEREVAAPKKMIAIPLFQKDTNYSCGTACVAAILQYFCDDVEMKEKMLAELIQNTNGCEMTVEDMVSFFNKVNLNECAEKTLVHADLKRYMTVCDLIEDIEKGIPVICPIQAWYHNGEGQYDEEYDYKEEQGYEHYTVAVGYDQEKIYFMDPTTKEAYSYIPIKEIDRRWHATENGESFVRSGIEVVVNKVRPDAVWVYKIM